VFKKTALFLISLLVAPGLGLFASVYGLNEIAAFNELSSIDQLAAACPASAPAPTEGCAMFATLQLLYRGSLIALIVSLALPLAYLAAAVALGRNRNLLARFFPPLVWIVLGILPLLLAAHGILVWFASWEMFQMGLIPDSLKMMAIPAMLGLLLLIAALSIVTSMRGLLELDPLRVTGVVLERQEMPELFDRVSRLARRLGSREPERIVLGIEPTAYVANAPIRLRGVGDLPMAESLYLPTVALRVLDDAELDALIGHELGHFRGDDLEFSSRFAPAFRSMSLAAESVSMEEEEEDSMSIALVPAIGFLSFMMYTLARIVSGIRREREFVADKASLEVSTPRAIASLLVKFTVLSAQWDDFRYGVGTLLRRGVSRRNFSRDYLARTREFIAAVNPEKLSRALLKEHTPHPFDSHPSLSERASAMGIDAVASIQASLLAMRSDRTVPAALDAIEERITLIDADFYRHPANPVVISDDLELPAELRFVTQPFAR
jgi:Zn-dependent protease with chaperone function